MENLMSLLTSAVTAIVRLAIIIAAGLIIAKVVAGIIRKSKKLDETAKSFLSSFVSMAIKILTIITALMALGIPAATFVTVLGSVGLAVSLAMQGALSNFAGGILIVIFHPFRIGDCVTVSGQTGVVKSISIFYTTIVNEEGIEITLPNGTLTNAAIVNTTSQPNRRLSYEYALPYATDVEKVREMLVSAASANSAVLAEPAPSVTVSAHDAGTVTVKLTAWTQSSEYDRVNAEMTENIKTVFDENGIAR